MGHLELGQDLRARLRTRTKALGSVPTSDSCQRLFSGAPHLAACQR